MLDFLNLTLPALNENIALDEALLLDAEDGLGGEVLRLWAWPQPAIVLGAAGIVADDVNEIDGVPLARRSSGGGTVLLGPGCLLFSLVLDMDRGPEYRHIGPSYRAILSRIAAALRGIQSGIELSGSSDLTVGGRKFSGNSQQRKRRYLLHHGTLLHAFDLDSVGRYLKLPPRRPEYRGDRSHGEFLTNLPDRPDEIASLLRREWQANTECTTWPVERMHSLVAEKYALEEWVRRR